MNARQLTASFCAIVAVAAIRPAAADKPGRDGAAALAAQAVAKNRAVVAARARIRALEQRVVRAGAWLDPSFAVEYSNMPIDRWIPGGHAMSGIQFKLQQTFYFPGKISRRQTVARGEVREERHKLGELEVRLRAAVKRAYYRLALVRQLRAVTAEHLKLLDQFIDVVRVKYEVGKVGQHELLRLTVLKGKLKDDLKSFDRDDRALTATINATLRRGAGVAIATPARLPVTGPPRSVTKLLRRAARARPLLRWYTEHARTRRAAARQAAREGYPDFTAWIGYRLRVPAGPDAGTDFITAGISVPIPFSYGSRFRSREREQLALARAAEAQRAAEIDTIRGALGKRVAAWQRAAQKAKTYRGKLMPQAHRTLDATFAAYQVDRADFASLYQAELQLLDFERAIRRAEAQAALSRVEVEALTGRQLRKGRRHR